MCVHFNKNKEILKQRRLLNTHLRRRIQKNSVDDFDFLVQVELGILDSVESYGFEIEQALAEYYDEEEKNNEALLLALLAILRRIYLDVGESIDRQYSEKYDVDRDPIFDLLLLPYISSRGSQVMNTVVQNASERTVTDITARALVIASTEVRVAQSVAERLVMERVNRVNPVKKFWVGTLDDRIRSDHFNATQFYNSTNAIGFNEMFLVGGEWLRYPRDTMGGSAKNTVNCRCYLSYVTI